MEELQRGYLFGIWDAIKHFKKEEGVNLEKYYMYFDGRVFKVVIIGEEKECFPNEIKPHYDGDILGEISMTPEKGNELISILEWLIETENK